MIILKPSSLGVITKVIEGLPGRSLGIGILGFFDLAEPDGLLADTAMWPFVQGALPANTPLDLGMPKASAEVLMYGNAMAPNGQAVPSMAVDLAIAGLRKQAIVFGDRFWKIGSAGLHATPPVPFTAMPVDYAHAFGGEGFDDNPAGKGYRADRITREGGVASLPNIEIPTRPVLSPGDTPPPHSFSATDIAWPRRARLAGTFDADWTKNRFPAPPIDQSPTLYNAAAQDQWIGRWFNPGEPFTIGGMHPEHTRLQGRLPNVAARCFIRQPIKGGPAPLQEVRLRLETVFLFPNALRGVVLFRGAVEVAGVEAEDVTEMMLAYERLSDAPRPHEHYLNIFKLRTDPQTKSLYALDDLQLSPELTPDEQAERAAETDAYRDAELAKRQRRMDRAYDATLAKAGVVPKPGTPRPQAEVIDFPVITPQAVARREVDFAGLMGATQRLVAEMTARAATARAEAEAAVAAAQERTAQLRLECPVPPNPGQILQTAEARIMRQADQTLAGQGIDNAQLREAVRDGLQKARSSPRPTTPAGHEAQLGAVIQQLQQQAAKLTGPEQSAVRDALAALTGPAPRVIPAATSLETVLGRAGGAVPASLRAQISEQMQTLRAAQSAAASIPAGQFDILPRPETPPPEGPQKTPQEQLDEVADIQKDKMRTPRLKSPIAIAPAEPLTEQQAAVLRQTASMAAAQGISLAGYDFAGADLSGLSLRGLDLTGAMFERANLTGTDFSGCRLEDAVFTEATLSGARFAGTAMAGANLCAAKADGAIFTGARLQQAQVLNGVFIGADFSGAQFDRNLFIDVNLTEALLRDTAWDRCVIVRTDLRRADFSGAHMKLSGFVDCQLAGAVGKGATLFRVSISRCNADGIDLSGAHLTRMMASMTSAIGGVFRKSFGRRSNWFKSDLRGADFARADLNQAFLGDCQANEASFYRADLSRAFLSGTDFSGADFAEANLFRATVRRAVMDRAELRQACLYGLQTDGTTWQMADLTGANMQLTAFIRG